MAEYCPECDCKMEAVEEMINVFSCPECGELWGYCPDCGEIVSVEEEWDDGACKCLGCAEEAPDGVLVLTFKDPEEMFRTIENIFGGPTPYVLEEEPDDKIYIDGDEY